MKNKLFLVMCALAMTFDSSNCTPSKSRSPITRPQTKEQRLFANALKKTFHKTKCAPYRKKGQLSEKDRVMRVISQATDWMTANDICGKLEGANIETIRGILTQLNQGKEIEVIKEGRENLYAPNGCFSTKPQEKISPKRKTHIDRVVEVLGKSSSPITADQIKSELTSLDPSSVENAISYGLRKDKLTKTSETSNGKMMFTTTNKSRH